MAYGAFIVGGGGTIPRIGDAIVTTVKTSPAARYKNTTWELVAQNRVPMGAGDGHKGGETVEAGLPNITGTFVAALRDGFNSDSKERITGAFYENGTTTGADDYNSISTDIGIPSGKAPFGFDASRSNPIYGASNTVQPPAYYFYFWRRVS